MYITSVLLLFFPLFFILQATSLPRQQRAILPAAAPFNYTVAFNQLMMSYASYVDESQIMGWNCSFCRNNSEVSSFVVTAIVSNATTGTLGYIGYNGNTIHVVFRGTVSLKNWILDLDAGHSTPYPIIPGAFVHTGFLDCWYSVRGQLAHALSNLLSNSSSSNPTDSHRTRSSPFTAIYFSGHSLGAAISVLAAIEIGVTTGLPITCYNFGDPRVGNKVFAEYFNSKIQTTWRAVNQRDIVPHLPSLDMGFWHIATEVWWTNCTSYVECLQGNGEDPTCSDSLGLKADSIDDHLDYLGVPLVPGRHYPCS